MQASSAALGVGSGCARLPGPFAESSMSGFYGAPLELPAVDTADVAGLRSPEMVTCGPSGLGYDNQRRWTGDGTNELPAGVEHEQTAPPVSSRSRAARGEAPSRFAGCPYPHGPVSRRRPRWLRPPGRPSLHRVPPRFRSPHPCSPNPALKYSVLIPKPCVPQGKRGNERLRNVLLYSSSSRIPINLRSVARGGFLTSASPRPYAPAQQPIPCLVPHVVLGLVLHVIYVDLVAEQDGQPMGSWTGQPWRAPPPCPRTSPPAPTVRPWAADPP